MRCKSVKFLILQVQGKNNITSIVNYERLTLNILFISYKVMFCLIIPPCNYLNPYNFKTIIVLKFT